MLYVYDLSAGDSCWSLVSIWSIFYKFLNVSPISIARLLREVGRLGARKPVNHTSWVADVIPTDRLTSVRNRCVIDHFCDVFVIPIFDDILRVWRCFSYYLVGYLSFSNTVYDHVHRQCTLIQVYYVLVYNDVIYMPCHAEQIYRFDANE